MKIGILECGAPPLAIRDRFDRYGTMMIRMLGHDAEIVDVAAGALPDRATRFDAYVLTGSSAGVYEDHDWIPGLTDFLIEARPVSKLVGICFGHQIMAQAFGGSVIRSPKGWSIGLHRYDIVGSAAWLDDAATICVAASHQDQVVIAPPGARTILGSAFTPHAGLDYGNAISFQFHPEFSVDYAIALIENRRDRYGALADPAIVSYRNASDRVRVAGWIKRFLSIG